MKASLDSSERQKLCDQVNLQLGWPKIRHLKLEKDDEIEAKEVKDAAAFKVVRKIMQGFLKPDGCPISRVYGDSTRRFNNT